MTPTQTKNRAAALANYATLVERQSDIDRHLGSDYIEDRATSTAGEWQDQPDRAGWWLWRENGEGSNTELLLLGTDGTEVAEDSAWEAASGKPAEPDHGGWTENYWESTSTAQRSMPGTWLRMESE